MATVLILGCWGREDEGFVTCNTVSNQILDLSKQSERNIQIADYLDKFYKLYDRPLYKNVHTAVWNIQEKFSSHIDPVFNRSLFKRMEAFCIAHIKCGVFLRLEVVK